jgi:hypothetical protein
MHLLAIKGYCSMLFFHQLAISLSIMAISRWFQNAIRPSRDAAVCKNQG